MDIFDALRRSLSSIKCRTAPIVGAITLLSALGLSQPAAFAQTASQISRPGGPMLSLTGAIDKAVAASPKLRAAGSGIAAAQGSQRQAELYPNPEASLTVENFAAPLGGVAVTETTVGASQLIELGRKRDARMSVASANRQSAEVAAVIARLDLVRDVTLAYAHALAAQQTLDLAKELESAAKRVLDDVTKRVNAARDPLFQKSKAEVAYAASVIARETAENTSLAALQRLGRFWGAPAIAESLTEDGIQSLQAPLSLAVYEARLRDSPDLEHFRKLRLARQADLQLAEANAVPDITASAGVRHFGGSNNVALVAGLSIPVPIFNQNQGEIARAGAESTRAAEELRQAELERSQELVTAWSQWQSAFREAKAIRERTLPEAERAFELALSGYQRGAFQYLEVLDAQRSLFDQRSKYVEAVARLRTARAETERLSPQANASGVSP
jgi:cobalt-zinc-cadmium efflux system outer membrane protein